MHNSFSLKVYQTLLSEPKEYIEHITSQKGFFASKSQIKCKWCNEFSELHNYHHFLLETHPDGLYSSFCIKIKYNIDFLPFFIECGTKIKFCADLMNTKLLILKIVIMTTYIFICNVRCLFPCMNHQISILCKGCPVYKATISNFFKTKSMCNMTGWGGQRKGRRFMTGRSNLFKY